MGSKSGWFVYIVGCADGSLYTGATTDVQRRVRQHITGSGARYTRSRGPVELLYVEPVASRSLAQIREAAIKRLSREEKQKLIAARNS